MEDIEKRLIVIETENKRRDTDLREAFRVIGCLQTDVDSKTSLQDNKMSEIKINAEKIKADVISEANQTIDQKMRDYLTWTGIIVTVVGCIVTIIIMVILRKT
jgi:hypothetical protein